MTLGPGIARTVLPKGFHAAGINCGVRRYRPDLGLITSEVPAVTSGVYTLNQCAAAPIKYCRSILPSSKIRAILTNSGQANAATGEQGIQNNQIMANAVSEAMGCKPDQVLVASTGVIGAQLELDKILPAIQPMLQRSEDVAENFALAILTTDLVPKTVTTEVHLKSGSVRITGICKGSGMIHPNMGTMLGYLLTDAELTVKQCQSFLKPVVDESFNMISVDGDTSTNDCVFLMANGQSQVNIDNTDDEKMFLLALSQIAKTLAQAIAQDGEGATKLIEVNLKGAANLDIARKAARGVVVSPLVKTAMHGEDPNWGRILGRLGAEQVSESELNKMNLFIQDQSIFKDGAPIAFDRAHVKSLLRKHKIVIDIDLKSGPFKATAWGCDLSKKYVDINTEYS